MLLTLVVPTRNRQWLARRAIRSALAAGHDELEIIVLDNSDASSPDSPPLSQEEYASEPRVRVAPSDSALSMNENWERALPIAQGRYIGYFSDKDVLLPGSLAAFVAAADAASYPDLIAYRKAWFNEKTGRLTIYDVTRRITEHATRDFLRPWYACPGHISNMPSLYSGFASTQLLRRARRNTHPSLFIGSAPDVASSAILCAHCQTFSQWHFHVAVAQAGSWSNGRDLGTFGLGSDNSKHFLKEYGRRFHEEMGLPGVTGTVIAEVLLEARAAYPEQLGHYTIDWQQFLPSLKRELDALQITTELKQKEWSRIYSPNSIVPRSAVRKYALLSLARRIKRTGVRFLKPFLRTGGLRTQSNAVSGEKSDLPPWRWEWMRQTPCDSFESALKRTSDMNALASP